MHKQSLASRIGFKFIKRAFIDLKDVFRLSTPKTEAGTGQRILIFNWRDTKHAFSGGAEVYIHELAKRWVEEGNQVTVFCGSDGRSKRNETIDGVKIIRRGGFYFVYLWAAVYYLLRLRHKTDLIVDCENGIPFFTPLYARKKKVLVIHHVHQEIFRKNLRAPFAQFASFLEGKLMPFVYRNVQTITVSPSSKAEILKHNLTQVDPIIVYNGIDRIQFIPGRKNKTPLVLYVGRLQAYKSLHILLRSVKKIATAHPSVKFVIAGDGEEKRNLVKLTRELQIENRVTFLGKVTEEEKIALYKKAWVFVNPSLREGWGITTIEANACGTPVVASDVSGLRDSISNGVTGILVPYGDTDMFAKKISLLLRDDKLRKTYASQAIKWATKFSWDASAGNFYAALTEIQLPSQARAIEKNVSYYLNKLHTLIF